MKARILRDEINQQAYLIQVALNDPERTNNAIRHLTHSLARAAIFTELAQKNDPAAGAKLLGILHDRTYF